MEYTEDVVSISNIKSLLEAGYKVEIESPDGFVPVSAFVDKGAWVKHTLTLDDTRTVFVNENHLFETTEGWAFAKDLIGRTDVKYLTDTGIMSGLVTKSDEIIPIVDIRVEHENHRYYANGVSSHNTGTGKSLFMCHMAASSLSMGKNVLYITLEMAEERIAERIDANLLNVDISQLKDLPKTMFNTRVKKLNDKTTGKLIIKEYPTASAHAGHFRALLSELSLKRSFKPDIIFVDYLNICASARLNSSSGANSYSYIKAIAEEIRGLAVEFDVPIFSATQTNRTGFSNTDVDLTNTSESIGVPATADLMFALISTEELEGLGQLMIKQLKNRYNDPNLYKRFVIGVDRSKMKLYDLEQSAQTSLADPGIKDIDDDGDHFNFSNHFKPKKDFSAIKL